MTKDSKSKLMVTGAVAFLLTAALLTTTGCTKVKGGAPAAPPEVEVVQVEQQDVPLYGEWIGTLDGMVNAEIKAQVSGYLLSKNYTEGASTLR